MENLFGDFVNQIHIEFIKRKEKLIVVTCFIPPHILDDVALHINEIEKQELTQSVVIGSHLIWDIALIDDGDDDTIVS
jgi:hypothetical protein